MVEVLEKLMNFNEAVGALNRKESGTVAGGVLVCEFRVPLANI